jgi:hypothetical protein
MIRHNLSYHILLISDFKSAQAQAQEQVVQDRQWKEDAAGDRWRR